MTNAHVMMIHITSDIAEISALKCQMFNNTVRQRLFTVVQTDQEWKIIEEHKVYTDTGGQHLDYSLQTFTFSKSHVKLGEIAWAND